VRVGLYWLCAGFEQRTEHFLFAAWTAPEATNLSSGVPPFASLAFGFEPAFSSAATVGSLRHARIANISAVSPLRERCQTLPPFSISNLTVSVRPAAAAAISGLMPLLECNRLISSPEAMNNRMVATSRSAAACTKLSVSTGMPLRSSCSRACSADGVHAASSMATIYSPHFNERRRDRSFRIGPVSMDQ